MVDRENVSKVKRRPSHEQLPSVEERSRDMRQNYEAADVRKTQRIVPFNKSACALNRTVCC